MLIKTYPKLSDTKSGRGLDIDKVHYKYDTNLKSIGCEYKTVSSLNMILTSFLYNYFHSTMT